MRKSKIILTLLIVLVLIGTMIIGLIGCDLGNTGDDPDPIITPDPVPDPDPIVDPVTPKPTNPTKPSRPSRPTDPGDGEDSGSDNPSSGDTNKPVIETLDANVYIGRILGGTKTNQASGAYRILNMYADIDLYGSGNTVTSSKRFIFRTNVNDNDRSQSEYVIKLLDMTDVPKPTPTSNNANNNNENNGDNSTATVQNNEGKVTAGVSMSIGDIANEITYESDENAKPQWAIYILGDKLYLERPDQPVLYFEDLNMEYVMAMLSRLMEYVSDGEYDGWLRGEVFQLLDGFLEEKAGMGINDLLPSFLPFLFLSSGVLISTKDAAGNITTECELDVNINNLVTSLDGLVGLVFMIFDIDLGGITLELVPLMSFLVGITPVMDVKLTATLYTDAKTGVEVTQSIGLIAKDNDPDSLTYGEYLMNMDLKKGTLYSDEKVDLAIPSTVRDAQVFEPFSLTNIALSLDLYLDSEGTLDVGSVINSVLGKRTLPEDTILVDAATGFRIDLALDLDLNYGRQVYIDENGETKLVDNNYIVLELYLIDAYGSYVDPEALIAAYYMDGAVYINIGHLLERYYSGPNIKINLGGVPNLVDYLVDLISNALDKVFIETLKWDDWRSFADINSAKYSNDPNSSYYQKNDEALSTASEDEGDGILEASEIGVVAFAVDEHGNHVVSTNLVTFLKAVGAIVGLGDIFSINDEHTAIEITVNNILMNALKVLIKDLRESGFSLPDGLVAVLAINIDPADGSIASISINATLDSRVGFKDADNNWYIGTKVLYGKVLFTEDGETCYAEATLENKYTFTADDKIEDYSLVYVYEGKCYSSKDHSVEVVIGYNADGQVGAYKVGAEATGINSSSFGGKKVSAYIYKGRWIVGYGLDDGDFIEPQHVIDAKGLSAEISIHDMMFGYDSSHLKKFDPASDYVNPVTNKKGGTSYIGEMGATSNIEGYILTQTHSMKLVKLSPTVTGTYYLYKNGNYVKVNFVDGKSADGNAELDFNSEAEYYDVVDNGYVSSVSQWINSLLGGTFFSVNFVVEFSAGKYNLAPLLSLFLPEMKDKQLLWEFTGDFTLDTSINIGISLNKEDPTKSKVVLELVANKDLGIAGQEPLFKKGKTILGVYGVGNKIYAELSNIKLLNIVLPNLSMELDYTTLLYNLIGEKEIFDLSFDLYKLLFEKEEETSSSSEELSTTSGDVSTAKEAITSANLAAQFDGDISNALGLLINSEVVAVALTVGGLQSLLSAFNVDLGMDLNEVMQLSINLVLNRTSGVYFDVNGALLPKWDGEKNVFDDDLHIGLRMATDAEYDEENHLVRAATPVHIGDVEALLEAYETKFEELASSTALFYDDLIAAILKVIGDLKLEITIDAKVLNSIWDINKIIDTIVADRGDSFALPINIMFDEWETEVKLLVQWYLDLNNFKNTQIMIEIQYEGRVWIGLYVYNNSIIVDLNGIGLFDAEISNLQSIAKLGNVVSTLISSIGDLSLTGLVGGLIEDAMKGDDETSNAEEPSTADEETSTGDEETAAGDEQAASDSDPSSGALEVENNTGASNDLLSMILGAISLQNFTLGAHITADVFEAIFRELVGFSMYLEFDIAAEVDIQEGRLGIDIGVERAVFADITLQIGAGERGAYRFEKDLDAIPDWNAITGEYFVKSIFNNLELGLYIDLNQRTAISGGEQYTRIYIEKLTKATQLANTNNVRAAKGSILVTVAAINEAEFNNAGSGTKSPIAYVELTATDLLLTLCEGQIKLLGIDVVGAINTFKDDLFPISLGLNLTDTLKGTLDGLIAQINGLIDGLVTSSDSLSNTIITGVTDIEDVDLDEDEDTSKSADEDEIKTEGTIKATKVVSEVGWNRDVNGNKAKAGKYFFYNTDKDGEDPTGTFYKVKDDGTNSQVNLITTLASPKDMPEASEENAEKIYRFAEIIEHYDEEKNETTYETIYHYYICTNITRRTYGYYILEIQNGLSGMFEDFDIMGLFDMLNIYLCCDEATKVGVLNADVTVNPYKFNYLIDNLLYYIFGPETILNLYQMTKDAPDGDIKFKGNYLADVCWNRADADTFWNDLWSAVQNKILPDLLDAVGVGALSGLVGTVEGIVKDLVTKFVPFAVANETHLGLNLVRGQLTNIYLTNDDYNQDIKGYVLSYDAFNSSTKYYVKQGYNYEESNVTASTYEVGKFYVYKSYTFKNGKTDNNKNLTEVTYNGGRSNTYHTNLYIFNTSPSVGDAQYTGVNGAITWDSTPTTITYNPYMYATNTAAAKEYYDNYFSGTHVATYQQGTTLNKANISFAFTESYDVYGTAVSQDGIAARLLNGGTYIIRATANFASGTQTFDIKLVAQSKNDVVEIDSQSLFVYEEMPAYIFMNVGDEATARRIDTSLLQYAAYDDEYGTKFDENYTFSSSIRDIDYEFAYVNDTNLDEEGNIIDGSWTQTVVVKFPNNTYALMEVTFKDSRVADVIIEGAKDNVVDVDLYTFEPTETLSTYTPDYLYFKYYDGTAGRIKVDEWIVDPTHNVNELFNRLKSGSSNSGDVSGAEYKLSARIATGTQNEQIVDLTFKVKSRKVSNVSFGSRTNTLEVQPYEYYLYLSDKEKYSDYNPYKSVVTVNYDTYSEDVKVIWGNLKENATEEDKKDYRNGYVWGEPQGIEYKWNIADTKTSTAYVGLDPDSYASGDIFRWAQAVSITVSRNQIQGIYFDKDLTQTTLIINPYDYYNASSKYAYYPKTAYVKFTNGKVLEMPVAWSKSDIDALDVRYATDYTQFTATIGFDINRYNQDGTVVGYQYGTETPFLQSYTINVKVAGSAIKGILMEGSEYMGGTYKIDPVSVNFLGNSVFPSTVNVLYEDGTTDVKKVVRWDYDFNVLMDQQVGLTAECYITSDLHYTINAEVLDRSASMMSIDTSAITNAVLNPYSYIVKKDGTITYDVFESEMEVQYATSFFVTLTAAGEDETFGTDDDIVMYKNTVTSSTELAALRKQIKSTYKYTKATDTYLYEGKQCKLNVATSYSTYILPVHWDTASLNLTNEGTTETVHFYFGYGKDYVIEKFVDVTFATKNVLRVEAADYVYELYVDAQNKPQGIKTSDYDGVKKTMKVYFTDGSYEYMDVKIDLTTAKSGTTTYGTEAFNSKTIFDYSVAEVGAEVGTYYTLGKYSYIKLRENASNFDASAKYYRFTEIATASLEANETYYIATEDSFIPVTINNERTNIGDYRYYTREFVDIYAYDVVELDADSYEINKYYYLSNNQYVLADTVFDSSKTYYAKSLYAYEAINGIDYEPNKYYVRTGLGTAESPFVYTISNDAVHDAGKVYYAKVAVSGDFYSLNDNASDRNAYTEVSLNNTSKKYSSDVTYYTLAISQIYDVTVTIGDIYPSLTQTAQIKMYVLAV